MGYKGNKYRHKKKKTLKKTKTRDIALRALKKVKKKQNGSISIEQTRE